MDRVRRPRAYDYQGAPMGMAGRGSFPTGRTLIAKVPGCPNKACGRTSRSTWRGTCTCQPVMLPTPCGPSAPVPTGWVGPTWPGVSIRPAVCGVCPLRSQCMAARWGGTHRGIPKRRSCNKLRQSGVRALLADVGCARRPSIAWRGWCNWGTISLLRPSQDPIPTTHGGHGGQPDPRLPRAGWLLSR